jgi:hypothetical protein
MMQSEFKNAEDEASARGFKVREEWDSTLAEIEEKWGLEQGCTLDEFCLTFKGKRNG